MAPASSASKPTGSCEGVGVGVGVGVADENAIAITETETRGSAFSGRRDNLLLCGSLRSPLLASLVANMPSPHLLPRQHDRVRVRLLEAHLLPELVELSGAHDPGVSEPAPVGSDPPRPRVDLHVAGPVVHHELAADDLALRVAYGVAVVVHLKALDGVLATVVGLVVAILALRGAPARLG